MKKQFIIAVSLLLAVLTTASCGNSKLSKEEAKRKIDEKINQIKSPRFYFHRYIDPNSDDIAKYTRMKDAGYIDLVPTSYDVVIYHPTGRYYLEVKLLDKCKPLLKEKYAPDFINSSFYCISGTYSAEIISIAEPAPDADGNIACNVEYKYPIVYNSLYAAYENVASAENNPPHETMKFIKTQEGWKIKE